MSEEKVLERIMGPVEVMRIGWNLTLQLGFPGDWNAEIHKNLRKHTNSMQPVAYH